jgi:hypothetical protein
LPPDFPFAETVALSELAFIRPAVRRATTAAVRSAVSHPLPAIRLAAAGLGPKQIASALLWRDTARFFEVDELIDADGRPAPEACVLRRAGSARRRQPTSGPRPAVTGVLIAQNEEALIGPALESLTPFVDELLVLDGGSTDDTVDVAASHGATVHHRPFTNDFAAQRNALLDLVRTPWVISLDCDERLSHPLGELVATILRASPADAILTPRSNWLDDDPEPSNWPDYQLRVHRSNLRYRGRVHEQLRCRRPLFTPINGPTIEHHKTRLRQYRGALQYSEIDPSSSRPGDVLYWRKRVEELEERDRDGQ